MPARCFFCWKRPKRKKENIYAFVSMLMDHSNSGNTLWSKSKNHNGKMSWYKLVVLYLNSSDLNLLKVQTKLNEFSLHFCVSCAGCIARTVSSPNQHLLRSEDVVSCCLDLSVPSISFRINGQPVQGMFENFNSDGLFFPVASFSAGVKSVFHWSSSTQHDNRVIVFVLHEACFIFVF